MKTNIYRPVLIWAISGLLFVGCRKNEGTVEIIQDGIDLQLRPDAVEPEAPIDIAYFINGVKYEKEKVAAGEYINLGKVKPKTKIYFKVTNNYGAGAVRANILTDQCFRKTGKCNSKNCIAEAEYEVISEPCINESEFTK